MSLNHSPSIVTNGLVYYHDSNNIKSYKGPPLQNLLSYITPVGTGTATGYSSVGGSEIINVPGLGPLTTYYNFIQNNYTSYTPNSGNCCPALFGYGGFNVTPNTTYTYGIVYKCDSGYTHPNFMYRYEYASNGGAYVTEGGVFNVSNRVYLGNGWYYQLSTFTTTASTNYIGSTHSFYYQYSPYADKLSVAKVMITPGNYTNLHPKYWPDTASTRSNTQALLDLTSNNTITASSLTYASDGTFSFNGSSNYINATMPTPFNMYCLDIWYYNNNAIPNNDTSIGGPSTYQTLIQFNSAYPTGVNLGAWTGQLTNEAIQIWSSTTSPYNVTYNRDYVPVGWHNTVFNWNGTQYDIWTDGVKTTTYATSGYSATLVNISSLQIGYSSPGYYYNGKIPVVKCYNRQLSDSEVKQNFNALRGRFGI